MSRDKPSDRFEIIREKIRTFPAGPGLYFFKDGRDKVLYIGKAKNLRSRVSSYFQPAAKIAESRGPWIEQMLEKAESVDYLETASEVEAVLQEARLIKDIHPPYNSELKDAKTFPYIEITKEDFPGVYITREPAAGGSRLFGPFTNVGELRAVFAILQRLFRFRTCRIEISAKDDKRRFFRPCILYNIKQCTAPCADKVSKEDYRSGIRDLAGFMTSRRATVLRNLKKQMELASGRKDYETAAVCRDRIGLIENLDKRGLADVHIQPEAFATDQSTALAGLGRMLGSAEAVRIIEGFDIAHIAGKETVGSMVQFIDGRPFKDGYRRYRIRTVKGVDDYASIREVLRRRYRRAMEGQELWPDVVLVDGGPGQLGAAEEVLRDVGSPMPRLLSIAKKEEIVYIHGRGEGVRLARTSEVLKLLQYVRDEAHRFAQHYHHQLRRKSQLGE